LIIERAANFFPNSAWLQARMSSHLIESGMEKGESHERGAERALHYAARAVSLAPRNYEFRLLLAAALEISGDLTGAEAELRIALKLAPNYVNVHWRLANLLLREGKLNQAISEFRLVNEADPNRLITSFTLLWQASDEKIEALSAATGTDAKSQLKLAHFLSQRGQYEAAVKIAHVGCATGWILDTDRKRGSPQLLFMNFQSIDEAVDRLKRMP